MATSGSIAPSEPMVEVFDIIWHRVTDPEDWCINGSIPKGTGVPESTGSFRIHCVPTSLTSEEASETPILAIAYFEFECYNAIFTCDYDPVTRRYDHFELDMRSMSDDLERDLREDEVSLPTLRYCDGGILVFEMFSMLRSTIGPFIVELWAKRRENGEEAVVDDGFLYQFSLGRHGSKMVCGDGKEHDGEKENAEEDEEVWESEVSPGNGSRLIPPWVRKQLFEGTWDP